MHPKELLPIALKTPSKPLRRLCLLVTCCSLSHPIWHPAGAISFLPRSRCFLLCSGSVVAFSLLILLHKSQRAQSTLCHHCSREVVGGRISRWTICASVNIPTEIAVRTASWSFLMNRSLMIRCTGSRWCSWCHRRCRPRQRSAL